MKLKIDKHGMLRYVYSVGECAFSFTLFNEVGNPYQPEFREALTSLEAAGKVYREGLSLPCAPWVADFAAEYLPTDARDSVLLSSADADSTHCVTSIGNAWYVVNKFNHRMWYVGQVGAKRVNYYDKACLLAAEKHKNFVDYYAKEFGHVG